VSKQQKTATAGTALIILTALLWSTAGAGIKYVPADAAAVAAVRCLIAGLVFLPLARLRELKPSPRLLLLGASYTLMTASFVVANKWTTALNAVAIQYTAPLWIFAGAVALGAVKLNFRRAAPMLLIAAGIAVFLQEPKTGSSLAGNLAALVSGVGFALVIISFRLLREEQNYSLVSFANLFAALILLPVMIAGGGVLQLAALPVSGWAGLAYLGAVQIGLAYALYAAGLKRVTALRASTLSLIEPVLSPVWTFLLFAEFPTSHGQIGAAIIIAAILLDLRLNPEANQKEPLASGPERPAA